MTPFSHSFPPTFRKDRNYKVNTCLRKTIGGPRHRRVNSNPDGSRFRDSYLLHNYDTPIGKGSHASVYQCKHKRSGRVYAVKILDRRAGVIRENLVNKEVSIFESINSKDSKYIVNLVDIFREKEFVYIVMELTSGGDLFREIMVKDCFPEVMVKHIAKQVLSALDCMHSLDIVHCDIKLENMLISSKDVSGYEVKVCDFSLSQKMLKGKHLNRACGTPMYMAPEVIKRLPYGKSSDMWSLGISIYLMLAGYPPFMIEEGEAKKSLLLKIVRGKFEFHNEEWGSISEEAKDFISALLTYQPYRRPSARQALKHPWIVGKSLHEVRGSDKFLSKSAQSRCETPRFEKKFTGRDGRSASSSMILRTLVR